jgi:hypothetical protein
MPWGQNVSNGDGTQQKTNSDNGQTIVTADGQTDRHPHRHNYPDGDWVLRDAGGVAYGSDERNQSVATAILTAIGLTGSDEYGAGDDQVL